jgi:putative DNA primase/helicase
VPCQFVPEKTQYKAPKLWNQTLKEIFPEPDDVGWDKINLLWQYFGYVLLPDCRYETSLWLLGTGANGKGTITDTMQAVIGLDNCSNLQVSELKDPRFNLYHLQNKMLNISTETTERDPLATEIFKKLVSGERVSTERKYGAKYDFTPFVKFVIGLNDMPVIPDKTEGFGRRVQLIRCDQKFKEGKNRDPDRKRDLREEVDGIFTWAVEGLAMLLANNGFVQGEGIKRDTEAFLDGLNPIIEFWREECDFDPEYEVEAGKLFDRHKEWFKENNQRQLSRNRFSNELLKVPGTAKRQDGHTRRMIYMGVTLRG